MTIEVNEAELELLLDLVERGETIVISRDGLAVAELAPMQRQIGFPFDIARSSPLVPPGDDWWAPLAEADLALWVDGC